MRDRVTDFLPLILVGVVLLLFQLTHLDSLSLPLGASGAASAPTVQPTSGATPTTLAQPRLPLVARSNITVTSTVARCNSARPHFAGGMVTLKARLGTRMGDALECEHSTDDQGDTQQKTTTGLAYYLRATNYACFTTGWDHWGLVDGVLVHWAGEAIQPPADALGVTQ